MFGGTCRNERNNSFTSYSETSSVNEDRFVSVRRGSNLNLFFPRSLSAEQKNIRRYVKKLNWLRAISMLPAFYAVVSEMCAGYSNI